MAGVRERSRALFGRGEGTDRIAFFSDAVFAIALTLLVLDLNLPDSLADTELWPAVVALWPQFFAYALTFAVLGINWVSHHRKFRVIPRFDTGLIWINIAFLMFVALAPFPTRVLAEYTDEASVVLYALEVSALSLLQAAIWAYAWRRGLVSDAVDRGVYRRSLVGILVTPVVFLATVPVALFLSPIVAMLCWILLWPIGRIVDVLHSRRLDR